MKRLYILIGLVAMAAMSCVREEEQLLPEPAPSKTPVTFHAVLGAAGKTIVGESNNVSWAEGDKLTVFDAEGVSEEFTVTEDCESFTFTSDGTLGDGPYYAVAGYGNATPVFNGGKISVEATGEATDGSFGGADLIASTTDGDSFTFHHVYAILKMSISTDDLRSLSFQAEGIAPGKTEIAFLEDGALDVTYGDGGNTVTVENISAAGTFYFPVNPGSYPDGFTIFLSYADRKMKIDGGAFTARTGRMVNFGALDSGTPGSTVWNLVTDASTLAAGDEIFIAASDYNYAMGAASSNGNNRQVASVTKSSDKSTAVPSDDVQILTLTSGYSSGTFGLYTDGGYLYAASSSKNYLKTQTSLDANGSWKITVTSSGVATIKASGSNSRNIIRYNSQSTLFSAYSTGQQDVVIYKKTTTAGSGPQMKEVNSFLDENIWGVYSYDASADITTPLYQYEIRNGAVSEGHDQYAIGSGVFRIQCLSEGLFAGTAYSGGSFAEGSSYPVTVTLYGVDGHENGARSMNLIAKKVADGNVWLQEEGGDTALIIATK